MAFFFLAFSLLLFSAPAFTVPLQHSAVLDVEAAIQRTLDVFSIAPISTASSSLVSSSGPLSSSILSLPLHPRIAVRKTSHTNYTGLLGARLGRDLARARSIFARVDLATRGMKNSDLRPQSSEESSFRLEKSFESPLVSGTSRGSGEYFARIAFGTPGKSMLVVPDTGSDVNWIQCIPCSSCYNQADPIFDPTQSSSYVRVPCASASCSSLDTMGCRSVNTCTYEVSYGDGSYTTGDLATETISFGSGSVNGIAIGCGHDNQGLFVGSDGLLGLGGGSLSLISQIKASSFSYCLVDRDSDSSSTLDFNSSSRLTPNSISATLTRNPRIKTFLYVALSGLVVGRETLSIPTSTFQMDAVTGRGGVIVDSGTSVTRLPARAYEALRDAFMNMTRDSLPATNGGYEIFDTCYDLSGRKSVKVPTVGFRFAGGRVLPLPAKNYLIPVDSEGTFCLAFAPTSSSSLTIVGNIQQQGIRVGYDLARMLVSFSSNQC